MMTTSLPPSAPLYRRLRPTAIGLTLLIFLVGSLAGLLQRPYADPLFPDTLGLLDYLFHPIERNAYLRAQQPPTLSGVAFTDDGRLGLAVGENGILLKSTNGGIGWKARQTNTTESLRAIDISANGQLAWAVGDAGTILRSPDGGDTWIQRFVPTTATLHSVTFGPDELTGWAAGTEGTVLRSVDGGDSWTMTSTRGRQELRSVAPGPPGESVWVVGTNGTIVSIRGRAWVTWDYDQSHDLLSVTLAANGQTGWAVGATGILSRLDGSGWSPAMQIAPASLLSVATGAEGRNVVAVGTDGTIVPSLDAGDTWLRATLNTGQTLRSVAASPEGQDFWAVGASGTIIYSADGGVTWYACKYAMYPAAWAWLLLLGSAIGSFVLLLGPKSDSDVTAPEAMEALASDQPISSEGQDALGRRNLPLALSHLLQNRGTKPPLTVAVTGEWGQGKTSIMQLLVSYMEGHAQVVWFNAWHHRRERHLFAALLEAVREQAVPGGSGWGSIRFRLGLMESRVRRHPVLAAVVLAVLVGSAGLLETWTAFGSVVGGLSLLTVVNAVRSWVPTAGQLLAVGGRSVAVRTFGAQLAFRHRFAKALGEVTDAFAPVRLLVVIDDLDRCQPEQVVETLEAVNFLVNAVACYVVMGFARPQVLGCVGLGFGDIASELAVASAVENGVEREVRTRKARLEYAERYLEKLINVELRVPKLQDERAEDLLRETGRMWLAGARGVSRRRLMGAGISLVALATLLLAIGSGYMQNPPADVQDVVGTVGTGIRGTQQPPDVGGETPGAQRTAEGVSERGTDAGGLVGVSVTSPSRSAVAVDEGAGSSWWLAVVGVVVLLQGVLLATVGARRWAAGRLGIVEDSPELRRALQIWQGVIRSRVDSPRQLKKFVNRVRFLARLDAAEGGTALREDLVVALGALQTVVGGEARNAPEGLEFPVGLAEILSDPREMDWNGAVATWVRQLGGVATGVVGEGTAREVVSEEAISEEVVRLTVRAICAHRTEFPKRATEEMVGAFAELAQVVVFR